ncbi:aminotransferase class I/II-fold pyridoxal phosphate-dependent enzyme [Caldalkalibacillus salinus]|uniref:aminotransferase class I/II-fold pyridoxal phosphate-dependent enzyme n=1 Tax=Caldalkalibacillus salinus TaxID=2803787 RepID=UPI0019219F8A|nr:aminotransferase class V-fold PLP-dependent enzyme [Caldalkalibacillus salinus]
MNDTLSHGRAPILEALLQHDQERRARFHVPGHKGGHVFDHVGYEIYDSLLRIDLTELTGLDDLHDPHGIIAEAQQLAAGVFHAEDTSFLVNGSTAGNLSMILGTLNKGDKVLVQRDGHKSVFHALAMAEVEAVVISPKMSDIFHIPLGLTLQQVKEAFRLHESIKAVILTTPNYYGVSIQQLEAIISYAHRHNAAVLVDEAHGAHFGQHPALPLSAMKSGADVSVQSTHKMLSSLTMTSMLHIQGSRIPREDIAHYIHSLQSSSPSYPLLASLDLARLQLQQISEQDWHHYIRATEKLKNDIHKTERYMVMGLGTQEEGIPVCDPFKLTIQPVFNISGYDLQQELEARSIDVEMADPYNVLLTLPLVPHEDWSGALLTALKDIATQFQKKPYRSVRALSGQDASFLKDMYTDERSTFQMKTYKQHEIESVHIEEAEGRRIGEMMTPYPPGVPISIPGEVVTRDMLQTIQALQTAGAYFQGKNRPIQMIRVLR